DFYIQIYKAKMSGSVDRRGNLRWKEFSKIKIPLPPLHEQQKIASVLSTCDQEIDLLEQELKALKEQKKGLMQLLLTGKVRVNLKNSTKPSKAGGKLYARSI